MVANHTGKILISWHIRYNIAHHKIQLGKRQRVIIIMPANSFLPGQRLV